MAPIMSLHVTNMHMIPIMYVVLGNSQSLSGRTGGGDALQETRSERDEPMICSNTTSIFHVVPLRPWLHSIVSNVPDALAPDYVFKP